MAKKKTARKKVETLRHKDKRKNIPTKELRDFVVDEELSPKTMLYPRDTSLDPQLVWTGKDEQDREDLAVPIVPIYIQEKIHPQAIIDSLPRIERAEDKQIDLFADFNDLPADFADRVDFYHHEGNWSNRLILGDSLLVMTSLSEKEGLKGNVQTIYIDPPYGIKFASNWQISTRKRDVKDGKAEDATRQPEQVRAYRDTWELGIHSYLAYLRDRLLVARDLLTETGSVFVQIGNENVHLVRCLMDEVFGSDQFVSQINFRTAMTKPTSGLNNVFDYILWYSRDIGQYKYRSLYTEKKTSEKASHHQLQAAVKQNVYPFVFNGTRYNPANGWRVTPEGMSRLAIAGRLYQAGLTTSKVGTLKYARFDSDFMFAQLDNTWAQQSSEQNKVYVVQTAEKVIQRCLLMTTDPGDLVLDPTCGSGTTAYVAEQWGRRWITCDTSRVALALARTRLMSARYPYYLLADSPKGIKKEAELTGKIPPEYKTEGDIKKGFVYERVPHITLKSIANNPDIKKGMTQEQIAAAIAHHADTETLFDQPYEDNKKVRVCGPFSVESLSPHRVLSAADENLSGTVTEQEAHKQQDFVTMILENLKSTGIQNTKMGERLNLDRLDPFPGTWIHASGEYTEKNGKSRRIAISIGPEHGTVGPQQVKEAAKEAVQGIGFDVLAVCGFAFDPHVSEEAKRYGKLTVLPVKMNPDLSMDDELLKKTGTGNLFMVFGEPDVEIKKQENGQYVVEIRGIDVYDPTTGQIRSSSTEDIACWFIDTEYNGESFFVRHAYFTGADKPYDKLKQTLRAEIDEDSWNSLYSTISRPFDIPESGKIAIKVINHYGDEVLKVFDI